jgi:Na+/H+-dicarboxylate symporter
MSSTRVDPNLSTRAAAVRVEAERMAPSGSLPAECRTQLHDAEVTLPAVAPDALPLPSAAQAKMTARDGARQLGRAGGASQSPLPSKRRFVQRWLTTLTLVGAALGVLVGLLCKAYLEGDDACSETAASQPHALVKVVAFPGMIWVRALKLLVVPMIFSSMIVSVAAVGKLGTTNMMAALAVRFYISTTGVAALTGLVMFNLFKSTFQPVGSTFEPLAIGCCGNGSAISNCTDAIAADSDHVAPDAAAATRLTLLDTLLNFGVELVPDNLIGALYHSKLLGIITFGMAFGSMLSVSPHSQLVLHLFEACLDTFVAMIKVIILYTPLGVGSLVAGSIAKSDQLLKVLGSLGSLFGAVALGQCIHSFIFYGALYAAFTRRSPFKYFRGLPQVMVHPALYGACCVWRVARGARRPVPGAWWVLRGGCCVLRAAWCLVRGAWCVVRAA